MDHPFVLRNPILMKANINDIFKTVYRFSADS